MLGRLAPLGCMALRGSLFFWFAGLLDCIFAWFSDSFGLLGCMVDCIVAWFVDTCCCLVALLFGLLVGLGYLVACLLGSLIAFGCLIACLLAWLIA